MTPRIVVALLLVALPAFAQEADKETLAKQVSNPISDLVSVPFQFNWDQGVGPDDQTRFVLNVQPVIPFHLSPKVNLITRVIVPFIGQPPLTPGGEPASGIGDILASFFVVPPTGGLMLDIGPVFNLPSTAEPTLGTEKWCVGPTVVVLKQAGPWTVGALWNRYWSFDGNDARPDVNQMFVQPFLAYGKHGTTITLQSESTANYEVDEDRWTVPVNLVVSKVSHFGSFPASYAIGGGTYVESPPGGPEWKLRTAITILLPTKK
jgi:hypothetical protein